MKQAQPNLGATTGISQFCLSRLSLRASCLPLQLTFGNAFRKLCAEKPRNRKLWLVTPAKERSARQDRTALRTAAAVDVEAKLGFYEGSQQCTNLQNANRTSNERKECGAGQRRSQ